jgi:hypothetical protein
MSELAQDAKEPTVRELAAELALLEAIDSFQFLLLA